MVRENTEIKGLHSDDVEHKLSQYVDDTEFLLAGDRKSFETCIGTLINFGAKSGQKINCGKTYAIWLGSSKTLMFVSEITCP